MVNNFKCGGSVVSAVVFRHLYKHPVTFTWVLIFTIIRYSLKEGIFCETSSYKTIAYLCLASLCDFVILI